MFRSTNTLVFYGLSLYSVSLSGNIYLNFIFAHLIEIPGTTFAWVNLDNKIEFPNKVESHHPHLFIDCNEQNWSSIPISGIILNLWNWKYFWSFC